MVETRNNDRIEAPASGAVQPEALSASDFIAGTGPIVPVFTITGDTALPESMGSSSCYPTEVDALQERFDAMWREPFAIAEKGGGSWIDPDQRLTILASRHAVPPTGSSLAANPAVRGLIWRGPAA